MWNSDMVRLLDDERVHSEVLDTDMLKFSSDHRVIFLNRSQPFKFCSNKISTAKYSFLTFLPSFLFEQFRRYSNCFFLFIAMLQQIPDVSPTGRYTTLVPLIFILLVSAAKEVVEDVKRHKADREINYREVEVLRDNEWKRFKWKDVCAGDIVRVSNNNFFPADLLVFSTSEPQGICYIETMNLDGETNLKVRQALSDTSVIKEKHDLLQFKGVVECDLPNKLIYDFTGTLTDSIKGKTYSLGPDQILLRGAMLRNTNWINGFVIYTGHDTKLMQNATSAPLKRSTLDAAVNSQIAVLFILLLSLCFMSSVFSALWDHERENRDWYLGRTDDEEREKSILYTFLTFTILYNNLIPISLQVSLEVVRYVQASFINSDIDMYHAETDTPAVARTSNLNEELGMVKYIFSDKTGTLTQNVMIFKHCSVAGILYTDNRRTMLIDNLEKGHASSQIIQHFLTLMSVCHTVIPERIQDSGEIIYHASSPDERALVKGAAEFGYTFDVRTPRTVEIVALGERKVFEVLNVLDFTSTRKRMSVIVRTPDSKIILYCKGADSVIFERLANGGQEYWDATLFHLKEFASAGFRTLCFAMTEISEEYYAEWNQLHHAASTTLDNREERLEEVANMVEKNLYLLGATAVEDKLQDKVPEAINALLRAGINVWILTGDKQETAINVGYSTRLLNRGMSLIILNETSLEALKDNINNHVSNIRESEGQSSASQRALIIDGQSLKFALMPELRNEFLTLCTNCKSVICCRVSPMQKAEVVELVRSNTKDVTLAIGDGANDVAMIQKAHVGIGISGVEGMQAACASDYSIAQFYFLLKLLFVHGTWNHTRMCKLILYSFYKNICLYIMELWFAIYSGWSGQILFERWTIGLYNVLFTAVPPLIIGIFDKCYMEQTLLQYPELYAHTATQFNAVIFWGWILNSLLHSIVLFWIPLSLTSHDVIWSCGREGGYLVLGNMVYTYVVVTVCFKAALHSSTWTVLTGIAIFGSVLAWFLVLFVYSHFWPTVPVGVVMLGMDNMLFSSLIFWGGLFIVPLVALCPDVMIIALLRTVLGYGPPLGNETEENSTNKEATENRQPTNERAGLLRSVRSVLTFWTNNNAHNHQDDRSVELEMDHGFAFSQEEGGAVSQSQVVRVYNTNIPKL